MLKWIKLVLLLIVASAAVIIGVTFVVENDQITTLILLGYSLPELSVGLWVMLSLLTGAILGFFLSALPSLLSRRLARRKDKQIKQLQLEVNQLRMASIKGS